VLKLLDNAVLTSGKFDEFNLAMFHLDRGRVLDHPHLHDMDEVGLLAHLRSRHGHERPADSSLDALGELHERLHREPPPSPA
jgi:hypothetical protein